MDFGLDATDNVKSNQQQKYLRIKKRNKTESNDRNGNAIQRGAKKELG